MADQSTPAGAIRTEAFCSWACNDGDDANAPPLSGFDDIQARELFAALQRNAEAARALRAEVGVIALTLDRIPVPPYDVSDALLDAADAFDAVVVSAPETP